MKLTLLLLAGAFLIGGGGFMFFKNNQVPGHVGNETGDFAEVPSSPNAVSSQTDVEGKYVEPIPFSGDVEVARETLKTVLQNMGAIHLENVSDRYIHAVYTTNLMRYKNDIEFFFDEEARNIHYRSESRVGYSDMGENRKQYEMIRQKFEEQIH
ncbi:DUF1499 domain-containing protein [Salisediminibacterium beveridgei]|uniref:DUF1499 domain-containing protein n=1 Tax=Salisediminibacterium beveridgei TaxID=632773 RepID=A0A1D7QY91_9BACI|nr:DUF1499 domain-containing protein [Salisediminibacterium beveridgei]AOM83971.1 hypothetical protein BBEV_2633 [Salisediminibacterium beveridgei]